MKRLGNKGTKIAEKVLVFAIAATFVMLVFAAPEARPEVEVKPYGFLRLDLIYNDSKTNNSQTTMWVSSEDGVKIAEDDEEFVLHPRLTRLGFNVKGGKVYSSDISGNLEIDFITTPNFSESRQAIRLRHAFLKILRGKFYLLAGQTWDVISPIFPSVNQDTIMWNAGNTGDRRPQLRVGYEHPLGPGKLSIVSSLGLTGAIDSKDLDKNGVRDGEDSGLPNLQARMGLTLPGFVPMESMTVGIWGHLAREKIGDASARIAGEDSFSSNSIGGDIILPIISLSPEGSLTMRGEVWSGKNLSDFRGGIGQGVNIDTGEEIKSTGGWLELLMKINPELQVEIGYTIDNPEDENLRNGDKTDNTTWYAGGHFKPVGGLLLGIEYINWKTGYKGTYEGTDNRVDLIAQYNF